MPPEIIVLMLLVCFAGIVQGTIGFGFGLVTMSTIPLWLTPKEAVPLVAVLALLISLALTWKLRAHLSWSKLQPLILGALVGVPIGVTLFIQLNPTFLRFGLGLALLVVCIQQLWSKPKPINDQQSSSIWGALAGLGGGILGAAFNTGGPPTLMYVGVQPWSKEQTVAILQCFFATTSILQVSLFIWNGTITTTEAIMASKLVIPTLLGLAIGQVFFHRINQKRFRTLLLGAIGILGCIMLYKSGDKILYHLNILS